MIYLELETEDLPIVKYNMINTIHRTFWSLENAVKFISEMGKYQEFRIVKYKISYGQIEK